ncbi:O-antigen ligase [Microbacterium sp. C7(2022)]|uniref:O-antigen ligase family protein n=1 Tax=Microbacterium sp. C7(2022) TaxID=2992759 RepID=UPI00237B06E9|nr:O-antigen ligase family protein [Microbacterium sp. C7(2022)]MDE0547317.1 O-antigen ligase family protein [Microbacterium sp. C7(2022)]
MGVYSKHPASAPPSAPIRETTRHLLLRAWCIFVLFSALAGTAWVNAFGMPAAVVITVGGALVSAVLWLTIRPPFNVQRMPWYVVAYVVWATASIIWSAWPAATASTLLLLYITTMQALFVGSVLTWHELVRAIASALKWVLGLSLIFELWVSIFVGVPVLPGFVPRVEPVDPILYWSRDNLLDGGRIQGIMGNANLLGAVALVAIIVFALRLASRPPRSFLLWAWLALAVYMEYRAASATAIVAGCAAAVVLITVMLMRRATRPGERTRYYVAYGAVAVIAAVVFWAFRDWVFTALGRTSDLTGRERIWEAAIERASERPWTGWGFSTPWVTSEPAFSGWIIDHDQSVMQAHNMWVDVYLQLGIVGLVLIGMVFFAFIWRAWFFAVDRPRWDLRADRPYSTITLLPTLIGSVLLVQGLAESNPLMLWGWMFIVMFGGKIKQSPFVGEGPIEQRVAIERGDVTHGPDARDGA